jgi:hypothetical protein
MAEPEANLFGLLAEFETAPAVHRACERVRDAGYTRWDAHAPFAVHGLDKAMGLKRSRLPFIALAAGLGGAGAAMLLQWFISAVDYPLVISGKPFFSWPSFVPVTFEFGVLMAAIGAVLGMLLLNRLPQLYHPLFHSRRFERATDDRFFISIEARDPRFDRLKTAEFLKELGAVHVEPITE